jgi:hypothetical protein
MERRETSKKLKFKLYVFSKIPFKAEAGKRLDWREKNWGEQSFPLQVSPGPFTQYLYIQQGYQLRNVDIYSLYSWAYAWVNGYKAKRLYIYTKELAQSGF